MIVNPLPLPDYPRGRYRTVANTYPGYLGPERDFRETADPSVLFEDGTYYLYSSAGMAWTSDDGGVTWGHRRVEPYDVGYAPTVVRHRGRYLLTACQAPIYASDSPLGPFEPLGHVDCETVDDWADPMLFEDGGRLFAYWGLGGDGIKGVELDPDDPTHAITPRKVLFAYDHAHEWERFGEHNEDPSQSYIEGPWMLEAGGRYWLTYCGPGTQFASYAMGTYVGDGPLGPFAYQPGPICQSRHGLIRGAGHGCLVRGHGGRLWCFYTCGAQAVHHFERRVGMAPARIEGGRLTVGPVSDLPLTTGGDLTGLLPANRSKPTSVSSGHDTARHLHDADLRTWWRPADDDPRPTVTVDLSAGFEAEALRLCWAEPGLDHDAGRPPVAMRYTLELRHGGGWSTVVDRRASTADLLIDVQRFAPAPADALRLTVHDRPPRPIALADLTLFARPDEATPQHQEATP